jgi:endoglucanase
VALKRLVASAALILGLVVVTGAPAATAALRVRGNQLVDGAGRGHIVQLRGVNRSGLEYACIQGWGFFDSPHPERIDDPAMIRAMTSWDINVVRIPLNEDCWLGLQTAAGRGGTPYRQIVERYVAALHRAGLYVILDLHWAAPGATRATGQTHMADADHTPAFWRSVASTFRHDHAVLFDLFNEPFGIGWDCWLHGCQVARDSGFPAYRTAGMQRLVSAVRSTGATQPLMLGGLDYSGDLGGWPAHEPYDPRHQLVAAEHNYGTLGPCDTGCRAAILQTHQRVPIVMGELGETDCHHGYIDQMMPWADRHGLSYVGWAWDVADCRQEPALIRDYQGDPTAFGIGFRNHLRALGVPPRL